MLNIRVLSCLFWILLGSVGFAQFQVSLSLDRRQYLVREPMIATVTVVNRSGSTVVLGGKGAKSWLSFSMFNSEGRSLSPLQATSEETISFGAGQTIQRKLRLSDTHEISEIGIYNLIVSAYHPESNEYYKSNRILFNVIDEKVFGRALTFGIPLGYPNAGETRQHALLVHPIDDRTYLYYRMIDERTKDVMGTFQLAPVTMVREPQFTLDRDNNLHVMFLSTPTYTVHAIVSPDGRVTSKKVYTETPKTRPRLFLTADNTVVARGGVPYVPATAAAAERSRSISERPPGL
jgi:hypothetical protein